MTSTESTLDPITLEVQWQRLITIVDEIDTATIRTSFSTIVGESHDFGCVLMDAKGRGLAQAQWSPPGFCTMMPRTTRKMLKKFPPETLRPGDVLITNDPWIGSAHLPDYNLITPVFYQDELIAFLGTTAHVSDVGGHRGDLEAVDVFQEGTRVPPTFFYRDGRSVELIHEFISANCRVPELVMGDLDAIVGTHRVGIGRLLDFMRDYNLNDLKELAEEIIGRSERAMRDAIRELPDGDYAFEKVIDGYFEPLTMKVTVSVRDSEMYFDFSGTSPQQENAAINIAYSMTHAATVYPIKCMLTPRIPNNHGLIAPLHVEVPEGSILNCKFPAPVKARAKINKHTAPLIFSALAPVLPGETIAPGGGIFPFYFAGNDSRYSEDTFTVHVLPYGGMGATRDQDGWPPVAFPDNGTLTPTEVMEMQCPVVMWHKRIVPDSGGPGRRRGGPAEEYLLECRGEKPITLTVRPDTLEYPIEGLEGGHPGSLGAVIVNGEPQKRFPPIEMRPKDQVIIRTPGGCGFGNPKERERERVLADLRYGYITEKAARDIYGYQDIARYPGHGRAADAD